MSLQELKNKKMKVGHLSESYGTLSETINILVKLGYTHDFNIKSDYIILSPEDFKIDHVYRFEDDTDPANQSILYAISSARFRLKGTLVNGYGISSNAITSKLIEKLETHPQPKNIEINPLFCQK
ncbi:MAG: phosphoribosylpyrophosphate synthetase [Bacteroidota bacterium]|jgi:hypothetical protein